MLSSKNWKLHDFCIYLLFRVVINKPEMAEKSPISLRALKEIENESIKKRKNIWKKNKTEKT